MYTNKNCDEDKTKLRRHKTSLVKGTRTFCVTPKGTRKVIHFTEEEAKKEKARMQKERGVMVRVYQCDNCKLWHVTTQLSKNNNRRELI